MDCLLDKYHQHFHQNISLLHHRRNRRQPFALWVMQTPPFCLFSTQVWFYGFSHSQLRNNGKTMAVICCHIDTSLVLSSTSTNGYLSATVTFLCQGGQSILWFLFKPLCNGHLSTRTINFTTKTRPQLQKNDQQRSVLQSTDEKVKNGHEIWSIWRVSLWWLISTIYYFDRIPFMP